MNQRETLKLALAVLEEWRKGFPDDWTDFDAEAITAIEESLAQPEQEPVATLWQHGETGRTRITMPNDITDCDARWFKAADLYTTPPQQQRCYCGNIYRLGVVHRESSFCDEHPRKPLKIEELPAMRDGDHAFLAGVRFAEQAHGIKE